MIKEMKQILDGLTTIVLLIYKSCKAWGPQWASLLKEYIREFLLLLLVSYLDRYVSPDTLTIFYLNARVKVSII